MGMKMTVGLNSRVLTAVSVLLVRDGYVFLSQRGPFDGVFQGCWQNVFSNVTGTESALAVATRKSAVQREFICDMADCTYRGKLLLSSTLNTRVGC